MDLAYDSSLPLRDLASCLDAGSQSGPGVSTGDEPASTAQGEASPLLLPGHPLHGKGAAAGGRRGHDGGRWWRGDPVLWIWCSSLCLVGLPHSRGWDACVGLTAVLVVFFSVLGAFHVPGMVHFSGTHSCVRTEPRTGDAQVSHVCLRLATQLVGSFAVQVSDVTLCK